jgi:glutathione S-transferase
LIPTDKKGRGLALMRFAETDNVGEAMMGAVRYAREPGHQPSVLKSKVDALGTQLKFFEDYLQNGVYNLSIPLLLLNAHELELILKHKQSHLYFVSDRVMAPDIALLPWIAFGVRMGATLKSYPAYEWIISVYLFFF